LDIDHLGFRRTVKEDRMMAHNVQTPQVQRGLLKSILDEVLVEQAKAGDGSAYAELCRRHSDMVMRVVNRIVRNTEDAEDVLQEAIPKAYRQLHGFDGRSKFSTWLTKIAVNSALMLLRKRKCRPTLSMQEFARDQKGEAFAFPDGGPGPESLVLRSQLSLQLRTAIRKLPPVLRDVAEIKRTSDFSMEEISEMVGVSVAATKSRLLRARKMLATRMVPRSHRQTQLARG
jgi:RNA polymerase sigma-70 factor, ECF subfamily